MIAAIFTLAGCGDAGGGGGGATTVKLTRQGTNVLVLTLTGTEWSDTAAANPNAIANLIFGSGTSGTQYFNDVNYSGERQADKKVLHITVTKQDSNAGTITYQLTTANSKLNSLFMYTTEFQANPLGYANFSIASGSETVTITID